MAIIVQGLSRDEREPIKKIFESIYLRGQCYILAAALHRQLGWPLRALVRTQERHSSFPHVGVQLSDEMYFDARGSVTEMEFVQPFVTNEHYEIVPITEDKLWMVEEYNKIPEQHIDRATTMARIIWPDLLWKDGEFELNERTKRFVEELDALSRKHGLWIRSPYPTTKPIISAGDGKEVGYEVTPTHDALGYTIDRKL